MRFLLFRLHGPMASWGEIAVGERRPTSDAPTRSAVLGLVAAALGLRREQESELTALFRSYHFACRVDNPGSLLIDFHTAQVAPSKALKARKRSAPSVRAEELAFPKDELDTLLSTRDYRCDALATACLWERPGAPWSLEQLRDALLRPAFVLYLGRKSCPIDLPLSSRIVEAEHPTLALETIDEAEVKFLDLARAALGFDGLRWSLKPRNPVAPRFRWDRSEADKAVPQTGVQQRWRRDEPGHRLRWQFSEREELSRVAEGAPTVEPSLLSLPGGDHEPALPDPHPASTGGIPPGCILEHGRPGGCSPSVGLELLPQEGAGARFSLPCRRSGRASGLLHALQAPSGGHLRALDGGCAQTLSPPAIFRANPRILPASQPGPAFSCQP